MATGIRSLGTYDGLRDNDIWFTDDTLVFLLARAMYTFVTA